MSAAAHSVLEAIEGRATNTVTASALNGGTFNIPLNVFISDALETDRSLVPTLSFLVAHDDNHGQRTNILFDLGLRRNVEDYIEPVRKHIQYRQPMKTLPDVRQSLVDGGVNTSDIAHVIISHVHWDHTGTPADYPQAQFWVGSGALEVLKNGLGSHMSHSHFESELFSGLNVKEFPKPPPEGERGDGWEKLGKFWVYDFKGDGSVLVVDAPGHLPGHVNLLARLAPKRWIYLVGDACHERRLLTGEKEIAEWRDSEGRLCCIHADKKAAEATLARIRDLQAAAEQSGFELEVILAHGMDWAKAHPEAFLPGTV
jgi:glyoxylase-like metal-dependent hydrolase (beta-lactamase superfamily II)